MNILLGNVKFIYNYFLKLFDYLIFISFLHILIPENIN